MNKLVYYLTVPILYVIAWLPFNLLYLFSDFLYILLFQLIGYRKKVVLENFRNSFPEKTEKEIELLANQFYRYFCDLVVESIKTLTISEKDVKKRVQFKNVSIFEKYYNENRSIIIVMGHFGNWELAGSRFAVERLHHLFVIYHPLSNKYFNQLVYHMRTRLGNGLYAMNETLRGILKNKNKVTATAFIADQSPAPETAYWTTFLQQDTPFFTGMAKIAKKMNYPIVYIKMSRKSRGFYEIESTLLADDTTHLTENEITEMYVQQLEQDIREQPEIWLWTHRKWKHKRPQN